MKDTPQQAQKAFSNQGCGCSAACRCGDGCRCKIDTRCGDECACAN